MKGEIKMGFSISSLEAQQPSLRQPDSESKTSERSFAAASPPMLPSLEILAEGIDHSKNITLETFKELSKEEKSQLTKIWTEQFIKLQELPTTQDGFLCLDLNLLNKNDYDTFLIKLKDNNSIVHLQLYNCK